MHKPLKFLYEKLLPISRIPGLGWTVRPLKLIIYTLEGLLAHGTMDMGAALTFYTVISIVPVLALVFAVVKGFGLVDTLVNNLYSLLPQMPEVVDYIVDFANKALARTQGGVVATVSLLTLFWAVIRVFESIEANFNKIWEVKSTRNLVRKYSDYITVVIIAPLLWIVATSISSYARQVLGVDGSVWLQLGSKAASLFVVWIMFAFVYLVLPNTKVRLRSAVLAGIMAGSCFFAFQAIYVYLMRWMTSYSAIYGSFAFLPLLLLWMQFSWLICLIGVVLSYSSQNVFNFDYEKDIKNISRNYYERVLITIMAIILTRRNQGKEALTCSELAHTYVIPIQLVSRAINDLLHIELIAPTPVENDFAYIATIDSHKLTIGQLLRLIDEHGSKDFVDSISNNVAPNDILCSINSNCYDNAHQTLVADIAIPNEVE